MFSAYSNKLYFIEYIVVFRLNDILVSNTTQRDGFYQNKKYNHKLLVSFEVCYYMKHNTVNFLVINTLHQNSSVVMCFL